MSRQHLSLEPAQVWATPEAPPGTGEDVHCIAFKAMFGANLTFVFGHVRRPKGYLTLLVLQQVVGQSPTLWRSIDVPYSSAFEQACALVDDAYGWAYDLGARVERSVEDLGPDDFVEHVRLIVEGGFQ